MQSIGKLIASQAAYYTEQLTHSVGEDQPVIRRGEQTQADYYSGHESPSRWMGSGLGRLNLNGDESVDAQVFANLMNHTTPSGECMTRLFAGHGKVAAYDHTFSAPKSVSLLFAFGDERIRHAVVEGHQAAVREAVAYMEDRCSQSRIATKSRDNEGVWRLRKIDVG